MYILTPEAYFRFPFLKTHNLTEMFLGVMWIWPVYLIVNDLYLDPCKK